jgi:hypothetical protein
VALDRIPFRPETPPLPPRAAALVAAAAPRIEEFEFGEERVAGFVASNAFLVCDVLTRLRDRRRNRFCEWGSGYGTVTGIASLLGWDATGIEIEPRLVKESRALLTAHDIEARIVEGSYLPPGSHEEEPDPDALIAELGFSPWDFDLVYVYPWPAESEMILGQFERNAPPGTRLVTFHGGADLRVYRQDY